MKKWRIIWVILLILYFGIIFFSPRKPLLIYKNPNLKFVSIIEHKDKNKIYGIGYYVNKYTKKNGFVGYYKWRW